LRLYEWEGKQLLAKHDVPVPVGVRWGHGSLPPSLSGYVVKAQTLAGQRGLRGGIRFCADAATAESAAHELLGMTIGDEHVADVYIEERQVVARELYAAVITARDSGTSRLLLSTEGGIDIEDSSGPVASIELPLDAKMRPGQLRELVARSGFEPGVSDVLRPVLEGLRSVFAAEDAELVEVNPLVLRDDGSAVAVDARIILDDSAAFRHTDWPAGGQIGSPFERRCGELGAIGVEMDGDIVAIVSGAGLMMATVDLIASSGGSLRAAIDLGGLVLREADELADLLDAVLSLEPRAVLINAFFQLATCDALARKLAIGLERREETRTPLVMRLRGRGYEEALGLLKCFELSWEPDLRAACRLTVALAKEVA
jgi:succinyl-CoA synthetase beta subunit